MNIKNINKITYNYCQIGNFHNGIDIDSDEAEVGKNKVEEIEEQPAQE